ncbi:hypothetical protein RSOLAG1IB_08285 [Rhizoctonia solani AG-1 IB]|uniref:Uncharacterized protein n=1 Tax=Thanatephorus cucumeris (strain AG1-IB / isolate 7/3/14) TaxID=1108050 RepID=A0A0B7FLH8_THACB|nr:hypothetical protein RSOLAG1IB_08285 [Rhizoctonia solani AG-1 IB]
MRNLDFLWSIASRGSKAGTSQNTFKLFLLSPMGALSKRKRTARYNLKKAREQCFRNRAERRTSLLQGNEFAWTKQPVYSTDPGIEDEYIVQDPYVPNVILWDKHGVAVSELVENTEDVPSLDSPNDYETMSEDTGTQLYEGNVGISASVEGVSPEGPLAEEPNSQYLYSETVHSHLEDRVEQTIPSTGLYTAKQPVRDASTTYLRNYKKIFRASKKAMAAAQTPPVVEESPSWIIEGVSLEEMLHTYGRRLNTSSEGQTNTAPGRYLVIRLD